jgi:hypothetical protein
MLHKAWIQRNFTSVLLTNTVPKCMHKTGTPLQFVVGWGGGGGGECNLLGIQYLQKIPPTPRKQPVSNAVSNKLTVAANYFCC